MKLRAPKKIDKSSDFSYGVCFLFLIVIIASNNGTCASELQLQTTSTEKVPVIEYNAQTSTAEPILDDSVSATKSTNIDVTTTSAPDLMPDVIKETVYENANASLQAEKFETAGAETLATSDSIDDKLGRVKRRAIRGLMQIFGMQDDSVLMKDGDQFGPAPEFMIDLYNTVTDTYGVTRAKNPYSAHVIRSFMERNSSKYDFFYFNLTSNGSFKETERVVEAELHLYRKPTPHDRLHPSLYLTPFYILSLYQVTDSRSIGIPDLHTLLGVHYVPALGSGWEVFNVTQPVMEWRKGEKPNLGFIVAATSLGGDRIPVIFSRRSDAIEGEKSNKQPILVLFNHDSEVDRMNSVFQPVGANHRMGREKSEKSRPLEKSKEKEDNYDGNEENNSAPVLPNIPNSSLENPRFHHSLLYHDNIRHPNSVSRFRSRRSKNQTEHGETTDATAEHPRNITSCSKHDLFISFEAIGWSSWIISPKGYNAFYCTGPCIFPLSHEVTPTNHATLQSIAHELSLAPDVGRPCCVPTKLLPISLLYYDDDDNVVLKQYVDMVADTCGCH